MVFANSSVADTAVAGQGLAGAGESGCRVGSAGFGRPGPATEAGRVHKRVSAGPSRSGRRSTGAWSGLAAISSSRRHPLRGQDR
jgi:hypothetical protein